VPESVLSTRAGRNLTVIRISPDLQLSSLTHSLTICFLDKISLIFKFELPRQSSLPKSSSFTEIFSWLGECSSIVKFVINSHFGFWLFFTTVDLDVWSPRASRTYGSVFPNFPFFSSFLAL